MRINFIPIEFVRSCPGWGEGGFGPLTSLLRPLKVKLDALDEPVDMVVEVPSLIDIDRVAICQPGERRRQVGFRRHPGMIDQYRNHGNIPLER